MRKHALEGTRVVDFSWIVAGPTTTRMLADFGSEVIRVENEQTLDVIRNVPPVKSGSSPNTGGMFNNLNRNKLGITLNVMHPDGMDLLHDLIAISDFVVENFSSSVLERWGLDYESQRKIRPDIIYLSLSGFGHSGRDRHFTTWGPTAQALSGLTHMSGLPNHEPAGWGFSYMDHTAGYYGAMACIMALHHRNRTGEGQWIDLSQVEAGIPLTGTAILDKTINGRSYREGVNPPGNRSVEPAVAPHNTYKCKGDDRWCAISIFNDQEWVDFGGAIGYPDWVTDIKFASNEQRVQNQNELDNLITTWTAKYTPHQVMEKLQAVGIAAGAVQTPKEKIEEDPQLRFRNFLPEISHDELGKAKFEGQPVKLSKSPWKLRMPSPLLGEHSDYVYRQLLGTPEEKLIRLADEAVF